MSGRVGRSLALACACMWPSTPALAGRAGQAGVLPADLHVQQSKALQQPEAAARGCLQDVPTCW